MLLCLISRYRPLRRCKRGILRMHVRYDGQGRMTNPVILIIVALIAGTIIG